MYLDLRRLIIAIMNKPRILVLDETLSAISIEYQEKLSMFISQICRDMGFTILLVSHQPTLAEKANTKLLVTRIGEQSKVHQLETA